MYNTGGAGEFNIAPKLDDTGSVISDPTTGSTGSTGSGQHSLNDDTQVAFVLGYYSSTNPRAIEQARLEIDDGQDRTPFDVYGHQNLGTLQTQEAVSLEYITDDDQFDLNGSATQDVATDFYPFGLNVDTAARLGNVDSFTGF